MSSATPILKAVGVGLGTGAVLYSLGSLYKSRFQRMVMEEGKVGEYFLKDHLVYPLLGMGVIVGASVATRRYSYIKSIKPGMKPLDLKTWYAKEFEART